MAGSNSGFVAQDVRNALKAAMKMGAPGDPAKRVTFRWSSIRTTSGPVDDAGIPYDLSQIPLTESQHPDTTIDAAVRHTPGHVGDTPMGEFDPATVVLTVLDVDYTKIIGADRVLVGGISYDVDFVAPPLGLFDLNVYEIYGRTSSMGAHEVTP